MPTKRNYGGEQQNYVPKGNEAGGQWGDDETGSNVNWKNPNAKESYLVKGVKKALGDKKEESKASNTDFSKIFDYDASDKRYLESWNKGDKTSRDIVEKISDKINVSLDKAVYGENVYKQGDKSLKLSQLPPYATENTGDYYNNETIMFHELGHMVDYLLAKSEGRERPETKKKAYGFDEDPSLSYSYKLKNGKTLNQIMKKEYTNEKFNEIEKGLK